EIADRERAEEMRERTLRRERDNMEFLARASDQLARALDYETTLATLVRLPVPFLADWTLLHIANDDGSYRCLPGAHIDESRDPILAQVAALSPLHLPNDSSVARAIAERRTQAVTGTPAAIALR